MKLRNVLLGLAVAACSLSLSGCAQEVDAAAATAIIEKNDAKTAPTYTKAVCTIKVEKFEVVIPEELEAFGITEEAVTSMLIEEDGYPTEDSVVETTDASDIANLHYSKAELLSIITVDEEFTGTLKMTADGDKLSLEMVDSLEADGTKFTMVSKLGLNEFNYSVYTYIGMDVEMVITENVDPIVFNYAVSMNYKFS